MTPQVPRVVTAALCTALQICFGTVYAWSFFQTLLVRQVGWSFTQTAWAFSITIFALGTSAAWAGAALPKMGPRRLALMGSVMFASGYFIAGFALRIDWVWLFYLGYGVIGGAGIGLGYVTPVATVAKWFPDRKGLATGIVVMGFGVGAFLLSKVLAPVLVWATQSDLPTVFLSLGVVFACILIPSSLLLRDPPLDYAPAAGTAAAEPDAPLGTYLQSPRVRGDVDGLLLQHRGWHLGHQLSIAAVAGRLGARRSVGRTGDPGRIRRHADRHQLAVQTASGACSGACSRTASAESACSASCSPARCWCSAS